ncbi:DUF2156 domain-containing protein [Candidatus Omnitrophota bacterium]
MKLKILTAADRRVFDRFLKLKEHQLSVYAFENIYIWKQLYKIRWQIVNNSLCVFFSDPLGTFMYLPPLADKLDPQVLRECFRVMDRLNRNKEASRIENVEEVESKTFRRLGYMPKDKFCDYLCLRRDLSDLKGNSYKPQRASFNFFTKNYKFEYLPFSVRYRGQCMDLYGRWAESRRQKKQDPIYRMMIEDSRRSLKVLLNEYGYLHCQGRIVKVDGKISAFTFGFRLNSNTFCILYEITDLSRKGLAQFIFRKFCRELVDFRYINIMDDSGLANLKKVKLSFRPRRLVKNYIIKRSDG